jgi:hypothetical protein
LLRRFIERRCWAGVDLSMSTDHSSVAFVFPCDDGGYDILPFFWTPAAKVRQRQLRDGMPYQQWAEDGFIELSPGSVIDYRDVRARIEWGVSMFDVQEICFDPWNSREMSVPMVEEGFPCIEVRQGFQTLSSKRAPERKLAKFPVRFNPSKVFAFLGLSSLSFSLALLLVIGGEETVRTSIRTTPTIHHIPASFFMPVRPKTLRQRLKPLLIVLAAIAVAFGLVWILKVSSRL